MPVRNIERGGPEFECPLFAAADGEFLADRNIFAELQRLSQTRNYGRNIAENAIRRLHERSLIQIAAGRVLRVEAGIVKRLSGHVLGLAAPALNMFCPDEILSGLPLW